MNSIYVLTDINDIYPDPNNSRLHSNTQLQYIAASLRRFGQQKPIVVNEDNVILAGNGTYQAAKEILNWKKIYILRSDLTGAEARAYTIADNQLADHSTWDVDSLSQQIKELAELSPSQDWAALGFDDSIIEPLTDGTASPDAENPIIDFLDARLEKKNVKDKPVMAKPIKVTEEQWQIIDQAIDAVKIQTGDFKISAGRALELIAGDFLGSL